MVHHTLSSLTHTQTHTQTHTHTRIHTHSHRQCSLPLIVQVLSVFDRRAGLHRYCLSWHFHPIIIFWHIYPNTGTHTHTCTLIHDEWRRAEAEGRLVCTERFVHSRQLNLSCCELVVRRQRLYSTYMIHENEEVEVGPARLQMNQLTRVISNHLKMMSRKDSDQWSTVGNCGCNTTLQLSETMQTEMKPWNSNYMLWTWTMWKLHSSAQQLDFSHEAKSCCRNWLESPEGRRHVLRSLLQTLKTCHGRPKKSLLFRISHGLKSAERFGRVSARKRRSIRVCVCLFVRRTENTAGSVHDFSSSSSSSSSSRHVSALRMKNCTEESRSVAALKTVKYHLFSTETYSKRTR